MAQHGPHKPLLLLNLVFRHLFPASYLRPSVSPPRPFPTLQLSTGPASDGPFLLQCLWVRTLLARTPDRAMGDQPAAGSGSNSQSAGLQGGDGAAATEARTPSAGAQRQGSPQFVGVFNSGRAARPWRVDTRIDAKKYGVACCTTRAEAAAAHDLALIWKRLHSKGGRNARGLTCAQPMLQCHRMACVPAYVESENNPPIFKLPAAAGR
jgi:hypothetical protein